MSQYKAFISYRHLTRDLACAEWLVEALETFKTPDEMVRQGVPQKVGNVFRDDNELASNGDLNQAVKEALYASQHLIVVCSKDTPMSYWVRKEITLFKHWGRANNIHTVLIGDNPQASYPPELTYWRTVGEGLDVKEELVEPLGLNIEPIQNQTESEAKALVRDKIIARLFNCDLATLRDRDAARKNKATSYTYFHSFVRRWGVPEGVGEIPEAHVNNRAFTYKFSTREGKVQKVERINPFGYFAPDDDGICQWDVSYRGDGKIEALDLRNRHGNVKTREVFSRDLTKVDFHDDNDSANFQSALSGFGLTDQEKSNAENRRSGITRHLLNYNEQGFVIRKRYAKNNSNQPARDMMGNYGEEYVVNSVGLVTEQYFLDAENNRMTQRNGVASGHITYDDNLYKIQFAYFDLNNEPVLCSRAYHSVRINYDEYGNIKKYAYFNDDLAPCVDFRGVHSNEYKLNPNGLWIESFACDTTNKLTQTNHGCSVFRAEYDNKGNQVSAFYFDENDKKCVNAWDVASWHNYFDSNNNKLSESGFDVDGNSCNCIYGYSKRTFKHDEFGNSIEEAYYDLNGKLSICSFGMAKVQYQYDEQGNKIEGRFYGEDEEPVLNQHGTHIQKLIFDDQGNMIEQAFFGTDEKAILNNEEYAIKRWGYDENANVTEVLFLDVQSKPVKCTSGPIKIVWEYDANGNQIKESYYDENNKPCLNNYFTHSYKFAYDQRGNQVCEMSFDINQNPTLSSEGYFKIESKFDMQGRVIENKCFNIEEFPCLNINNIHCIKYKYNVFSKVTEIHCFGIQNEPITTKFAFHRGLRMYNRIGQLIETHYFDQDDKLLTEVNISKEDEAMFWFDED